MRRSANTLERQWTLLRAIPAHPRWLSTRDLHGQLSRQGFDASIRTTQRDLDWLSATFPLSSDARGRTQYWQWMKGATGLEIPAMSPVTALVFQLVEKYLKRLVPPNLQQLMEPYMERSAEVLGATSFKAWRNRVLAIERGPYMKPPRVSEEILDGIYRALMEGKQMNLSYVARYETVAKAYTVNPLGMVLREGVMYLVCTLWDYEDVRQLAIHRVKSAEPCKGKAKRKRGFDLKRYIREEAGFGYPESNSVIKLKALFDEGAAYHLGERRLSNDQVLEQTEEGMVLLTATVSDTSELRWWLRGFGDLVEVIEPRVLRKEFASISKKMADAYKQPC